MAGRERQSDIETPFLAPATEAEHEHRSKREELKSGVKGQFQRLSDYLSKFANPRHEFTAGRRNYAIYVLIALFLIQLVSQADRLSLAFLRVPLVKDLGLHDAQYALLISYGFVFLYAILNIPAGRLADLYSKKDVLFWGIIIWSIATACIGLAHKFWHVVAARLGQGAGQAALPVTAFPLLAAYFPPEWQPLANSIYTSAVYLGGTGLASVSGPLSRWFHLSWRGLLMAYGIIGAVLALIFYPTVLEPRDVTTLKKPEPIRPASPGAEAQPRSFRDALVEGTSEDARASLQARELSFQDAVAYIVALRSGWRVYIAAGLRAFGTLLFAVYAPAFLISHFPGTVRASPTKTAYTYGLIATFVGAGSSILGGLLTTRWQRREIRAPALVPAIGAVLAVPFILSMYYSHYLAGGDERKAYSISMWSVALAYLFGEVWSGPSAAVVQQTHPLALQGTGFGFYSAIRALVAGAGPSLIAVLEGYTDASAVHEHKKYTILITIVAAYLLSALVYYMAGESLDEDIAKRERFEESVEVPESDITRVKAFEYGFLFFALLAGALAWSTLHL